MDILKFDNELSILLDELSYPYIAGSVVDYKEDLITIFMTQKFPDSYEYVVELNKYIYRAIQ